MTATRSTALGLHVALLLNSGCAFVPPIPHNGRSLSTGTVSPSSTSSVSSRGGVASLEAGLGSFFSLDSITNLFQGEDRFDTFAVYEGVDGAEVAGAEGQREVYSNGLCLDSSSHQGQILSIRCNRQVMFWMEVKTRCNY